MIAHQLKHRFYRSHQTLGISSANWNFKINVESLLRLSVDNYVHLAFNLEPRHYIPQKIVHCKGKKYGDESHKIPFPPLFLFFIFYFTNTLSK